MYNAFIQKVKTRQDVYKLQDEVDLLLKALYQNKDKYDDVLNNSIRNWVAELILEEVEKNKVSIDNYLQGLKRQLESVKAINLTISFEPTPSAIENICNWVRQNLGQGIVINFVIDPKIIAGAIISYKGKYIDLSLLTKFNESFDELIRNIPQKAATTKE
jgi:hypothetical protein